MLDVASVVHVVRLTVAGVDYLWAIWVGGGNG